MNGKEKLAERLSYCGVDGPMIIHLCNFFSSKELEEFVEFLEDERR